MSRRLSCPVCEKHRHARSPGGPVLDSPLLYVGHAGDSSDQGSTLLGYYLVEPKRHVPGIAQLTDREASALGLAVSRVSRAVQSITGAEHIYLFVLGHHVEHLHVHLVPRYAGTPREYWGLRADEWPDAPRGTTQEIAELCAQVRGWLHNVEATE